MFGGSLYDPAAHAEIDETAASMKTPPPRSSARASRDCYGG
jgi:hypothetical protein